jgi:iron complex outermembrane recepter protein
MSEFKVCLIQLSLLPLLITTNPVVAETISDRSHRTAANSIQNIPPRHQVSTSAKDLLAQQNKVTRVTGVELNQTNKGLEVILKTAAGGQRLVPLILPEGNNLVIDILDVTLAFSIRNGVTKTNPAPGIKTVNLAKVDESSIRLTITGEKQAPSAEVLPSPQNLVLSVNSQGNTAQQAPDEEIEIIATGEAEEEEDSYYVPDATTATKTDIPIQDTPTSIQVIPKEVIEDRRVVRLNELADNVSGVTPLSGYGGISSQGYYLRGFALDFESYRNGFKDFGFISPRDVANVERVEFLKGPASVLYGGGFGFSGLVNTVTKKPVTEPLYNLDFTIGNNNFYRPTLDFGGALTEDKSLAYRLNVAYENADSFRDFNKNEGIFVAPALTWQIGDRTKITAEFEYQNYNYVFDRGLLPSQTFLDLPISRFLGEPGINDAEFDSFSGTYDFEHKFSDNWKFRQGFNAVSISGNEVSVGSSNFDPPFVEEDGRTLFREASSSDESSENYALQNEISGKFKTGKITHNALFGVELAKYRFAYDFFDASIDSIDIFAPVYGAEPSAFVASSGEEYGSDNIGVYLQDFAEISSQFKVLAGVRLDWSDSFYQDTLTDSFNFKQSDFAASPRLGIVYQPTKATSLYASWTNSFNPEIFSRSATGEAFEPTKGRQFEIGVKQEFLDGKASGTLALYDLTKKNVLTTDPEDPDFSIQTGEQKSRGVELDMAGEILPGWKVIATYAYTDAFVSEDEDLPEGDRLSGVPENSASLWTTYEFQQGDLQGLGFGFGLYFVGDREVELPNSIQLDSYVRADAAIFYRRDKYELALNFKNITGTEYYSTQGFFITPEAPFTVLGNVSVKF